MAFQPKSGAAPKGQGNKPSSRSAPKSAPRSSAPAASRPAQAPIAPWSVDQWQAALPEALEAVGVQVTPGQQRQLADYMVLLAHWNSTFNLTALRDPRDMLSHHLMDCLTVLAPLCAHLDGRGMLARASAPRLLDVGSGGGLPGVVLAICCPSVQVTCVDTVGKKAAFIRQVAAELKLPNLRAEHARVEQLKGQFDVITSRAFASLADFVTLTRALLPMDGVWMAMKGKQPDEEVAVLPRDVSVFHVEQLTVPGLDAQRCLVWMKPLDAVTRTV